MKANDEVIHKIHGQGRFVGMSGTLGIVFFHEYQRYLNVFTDELELLDIGTTEIA